MKPGAGHPSSCVMKPAGTNKPGRRWVLPLKLLVSAGLLIWLARSVPLADALKLLPQARPSYVLLAIVLLGMSLAVSGWRWWLAADGGLSLMGCIKYTWVSAFWSLVLPGALSADVAKGVAMKTGLESGSGRVLTLSILMDRAAGLGVLTVVGLGFLWWSGMTASPHAVWLPAAAVMILVALLVLPRVLSLPIGLARWLQVLALSLLITGINVSFYWACSASVGGQDSWPHMGSYTVLLNLAMLLPVSIGGVGIREQLSVFMLSNASGAAGSVAFSWMVLLVTLLHGLIGLALQMKRSPSSVPEAAPYLPFQRKT